jgi:carbamoyltransferase
MRFDSLCAGLQLFTEELMTRWVRAAVTRTGVRRVLAAGGVFMNVKANKAISELEEVDRLEAFPSCGDESLAFGACYLAAHERGEEILPLEHCYLGNDLGRAECQAALLGLEGVEVEEPADMAGRAAGLLAEGKIVARAAGPMEFGARALGNRSILADPVDQDVVRIINRMIKKRDFWMPFAPVVMRAEAAECFRNPKDLPSPYMMNTFDSTAQRRGFMAAVHQADLTARPQLLEEGQNPEYEAILRGFARLTGRKVLLNTSFNLHGYPVVCSAQDAVEVLRNSGLTRLILGPFLVSKKGG